jgi:hypothetical protein
LCSGGAWCSFLKFLKNLPKFEKVSGGVPVRPRVFAGRFQGFCGEKCGAALKLTFPCPLAPSFYLFCKKFP